MQRLTEGNIFSPSRIKKEFEIFYGILDLYYLHSTTGKQNPNPQRQYYTILFFVRPVQVSWQ